MNALFQKVQKAISTGRLIPSGSHILVGVSGGADSVALLHTLQRIKSESLKTEKLKSPIFKSEIHKFEISVFHLNHSIRAEAPKDALFVKKLCQKLNIPFYTAIADVPKTAAATGVSLEMAARDARYRFFKETAENIGAACVATAHTLDDQAETLLLKLCRGAGSAGMDGIADTTEIQGLKVIRPMLTVSRSDVENFLKENSISWREDATNRDTQLKRNYIRHKILPLLEQNLNPRIKEALARTCSIMAEDNSFMEMQALPAFKTAAEDSVKTMKIEMLQMMPPAIRRRVLRQWLISNGFTAEKMRFDVIERMTAMILSPCGTAAVSASANTEIRREYDRLIFDKKQPEKNGIQETRLNIPGETLIESHGLKITATIRKGFERTPTGPLGKIPADAVIRWDKTKPADIYVRSWHNGDRIQPFGMNGSCKLQNLFTDAKIPQRERRDIPLFICKNEIIWIPGYRISAGMAVADTEQSSLQISVTPIKDEI
jgi:tRNA(Ile)-lysidine synthase